MNAIQAADTKNRILEVAHRLFATKGFNGTSIRDIASEAEVNIAAINYHFQNKQALYWAVTAQAHTWLEESIGQLADKYANTTDLALAIFDFLNANSTVLKNAFTMFLSDSVPEIDEQLKAELKKEDVGPPGRQYLLAKIDHDLGVGSPLEGKRWAVKNIFTAILHWALLAETGHCKTLYKDHPDFQADKVRQSMAFNVQAALEFVKNHPEHWG